MAVLGINYSEPNYKTYKSVSISWRDYDDNTMKNKIFNSGDIVKDWYFAIKYAIQELQEYLTFSSSYNHFFMDGGDKEYKITYLHIDDNDNAYLSDQSNDSQIPIIVNLDFALDWLAYKAACGDPTTSKALSSK